MSQVNMLIQGINRIRKKEQRASNPNRMDATPNMLHKIPGFKVEKKKK